MKDSCACDSGADIDEDTRSVSQDGGDLREHLLGHGIVRVDVEHIDGAILVAKQIDPCGDQAAGEIETGAPGIILPRGSAAVRESRGKTQEDKKDMPGKGVDGEGKIPIVHAAGVKEGKDAAQHAEIHEKGGEDLTEAPATDPGQEQADVHGDATELEGKIPPVVLSAAKLKGQCQLLPDLASQHEKSAQEEKPVCACRKVSVP